MFLNMMGFIHLQKLVVHLAGRISFAFFAHDHDHVLMNFITCILQLL
jgi:hypothetical protein